MPKAQSTAAPKSAILLCFLAFSLPALLSGCAGGAEVIAGDVAGSIFDKTGQIWQAGKLQAFCRYPWQDVAAADRRGRIAGLKVGPGTRSPRAGQTRL